MLFPSGSSALTEAAAGATCEGGPALLPPPPWGMRGADALIEALERHGIETIVGVPGGAVLPLYDALAAAGDRQVVCVTGDGSLLMHVQELVTASAERLPVKVLLLDNQSLGMVRAQQDRFFSGTFAAGLGTRPDWRALALACGIGVADSVEGLLGEPGPALHHVPIPSEAECLPMVAPGTSSATMVG